MDTRSISRRITHPRHAPNRIEMVVAGNIVGSFVCQTNVGNKSCSRVTTREREGGRGEGRGVIAFKAPVRISSKVSDKFLASFFSRAEKFSYSTRRRPLFPSCANLEQLYIYIYICHRASILFLPRVKLAQFSLTSDAWPWLSFAQLFKPVCLTLRLPRFSRYLTRFFYFSRCKVGTRLF